MFNLVPFETRWNNPAFDHFFADFRPALASPSVNGSPYAPRVDIREDADALIVTAEIPGIAKDGVNVEVHKSILTISGEKKVEQADNENGVHRTERVYGAFKRSFSLPDSVSGDEVDASYKDGVLTVRLAKRPESKPRQITVKN